MRKDELLKLLKRVEGNPQIFAGSLTNAETGYKEVHALRVLPWLKDSPLYFVSDAKATDFGKRVGQDRRKGERRVQQEEEEE